MMQAISRENSGLRAPFFDASEARSHQPYFERYNSKRRSFFSRLGKVRYGYGMIVPETRSTCAVVVVAI